MQNLLEDWKFILFLFSVAKDFLILLGLAFMKFNDLKHLEKDTEHLKEKVSTNYNTQKDDLKDVQKELKLDIKESYNKLSKEIKDFSKEVKEDMKRIIDKQEKIEKEQERQKTVCEERHKVQ